MNKQLRALMGVVTLMCALGPSAVGAASKLPNYRPMDAGPRIRQLPATPDMLAPVEGVELADEQLAAEAAVEASATDCITAAKYFLILNDYLGRYQVTTFNLMGESANSQVWVQTNMAWPVGDPRPTPVITCEQVQYMIGQFDGNIYPKETAFFGIADFHDGASAILPSLLGLPSDYYYDAAGRQIVLISNVRDSNYYDPTYPNYIAGFYSPSFEVYFDRNTMTIDSYDWANRTGPDSTRPYLYEGIFAHEYQHLLHDDYDSDEENFVNEGMADLAAVLTGYPQAVVSHLHDAAQLPENSLVLWGDQGDLEILADYGNAFLFQYYLMEHFGEAFIQELFHNPLNGISGLDDTLAIVGSLMAFGDVYHNWAVAKLIDSKTPNDGYYQFKGLDFKLNIGTPAFPNPQAYDTPGAGPWGTDYIWIQGDPKNISKVTFNGLDYSTFPTAWTSDGNVLWSGTGDLADNWAIFEATAGTTLSFDTYYDIEDYWDFGFVQVSMDGGYTWASLSNAYTTYDHDPNAHPDIVMNLPGLTGVSGGWVNMSFDTSAYAGVDVLFAFRYMTDWATPFPGWYVDNVYVDGTLVSDGSDASMFKELTEMLPINNDFTVTFVGLKSTVRGNQYKALTLDLDRTSETGWIELNSILRWSQKAVMLVTLDASEGFTTYTDYTYDFVFKTKPPTK